MKYKYTGSSPAMLSIDGKLTKISSGAVFISDNTYSNNPYIENVPGPGRPKREEQKVTKKMRKKVDGKPSSDS